MNHFPQSTNEPNDGQQGAISADTAPAPDRSMNPRSIPTVKPPLYRKWFLASAIQIICLLFQIWIFSIDYVISNMTAQIFLHSQSFWIPILLIAATVLGWNIRGYFARSCALGLVYLLYETSYSRY